MATITGRWGCNPVCVCFMCHAKPVHALSHFMAGATNLAQVVCPALSSSRRGAKIRSFTSSVPWDQKMITIFLKIVQKINNQLSTIHGVYWFIFETSIQSNLFVHRYFFLGQMDTIKVRNDPNESTIPQSRICSLGGMRSCIWLNLLEFPFVLHHVELGFIVLENRFVGKLLAHRFHKITKVLGTAIQDCHLGRHILDVTRNLMLLQPRRFSPKTECTPAKATKTGAFCDGDLR